MAATDFVDTFFSNLELLHLLLTIKSDSTELINMYTSNMLCLYYQSFSEKVLANFIRCDFKNSEILRLRRPNRKNMDKSKLVIYILITTV